MVPRLPGTGHTGDRVRTGLHIDALNRAGFEVELVGGRPWTSSPVDVPGLSQCHAVPLRPWTVAGGLARAVLSGRPLQTALQAGPWSKALAACAGPFDLVVCLLVRLWPHVDRALPKGPLVLDYIDALGAAAQASAAHDPARWRRLYWRYEAPRLLALEAQAAGACNLLLATTEAEAAVLPKGTRELPLGVPIGPRPSAASTRPPVVAFSGRLKYRPNVVAAERLVKDIWPRVLSRAPQARLAIGGAEAPRALKRLCASASRVSLVSPVDDMSAFLRGARAVAAPVSLGGGTSLKLLEAFEAGTPVVASREVAARVAVPGIATPCALAASDEELAEGLIGYLQDPAKADSDGARARAFVETHFDREVAVKTLAGLFRDLVSKP